MLNTSNVIRSHATLIEDRVDGEVPVEHRTESIKHQTDDLASVVDDVRFLLQASEETDSLAAVGLTETIEAELERLRTRHDSVTVNTDLPPSTKVRADDLVGRLFVNLFRNAVEHAGGRVSLAVDVTERDGRAVVRVEDDGPGVPEDLREGLFDPGVDRADEDSRLGTVIVGRLAERYGGRVELTRAGPSGTTITVELPLAEPPVAEGSAPDRSRA